MLDRSARLASRHIPGRHQADRAPAGKGHCASGQYTGWPCALAETLSLPSAARSHIPYRISIPHVNPIPEVETAVPGLDPQASRRWQLRRRATSPWLNEEIAARMAERLHWFREKPGSWLHWEPALGGFRAHRTVRDMFPQAEPHIASESPDGGLASVQMGLSRSWNPIRWLKDKSPKPVSDDTVVDMLWANMVLHQEPYPQTLLRRWHGHIKINGYLMFSCLGPDTLRELREVYAAEGWPAPTHAFTDMHDWGDMLVHSGFAEPVMDMERLTLSYSSAAALLDDLRDLGRNLGSQRFSHLRSRGWRLRLEKAIEARLPRSDDGRLPLTIEVIYGHAFKAEPRAPRDGPASTSVSVDEMRSMLRSGRR